MKNYENIDPHSKKNGKHPEGNTPFAMRKYLGMKQKTLIYKKPSHKINKKRPIVKLSIIDLINNKDITDIESEIGKTSIENIKESREYLIKNCSKFNSDYFKEVYNILMDPNNKNPLKEFELWLNNEYSLSKESVDICMFLIDTLQLKIKNIPFTALKGRSHLTNFNLKKKNQIDYVENELFKNLDNNTGKSFYSILNKYLEIKSNPKKLVQILKDFTNNEGALKYTTHKWMHSNNKKDFSQFLEDVTEQVNEHKNELKMLSLHLYKKIYDFIVNTESGIGWSSLKGLKEYMEHNNEAEPSDFKLPKNLNSTMKNFNDRIEEFKNEIEIRENMLQGIFTEHKTNLGKDYNIDISENLKGIEFYTDVEYFKEAIGKIFIEIKKYAANKSNKFVEVSIYLGEPALKEYIELHITHKGSCSVKSGQEMLQRIKKNCGDIGSIGGWLKNLCDWHIVAKHKEGDFKIDCFGGTSEQVKNAEGFTHILRFYR